MQSQSGHRGLPDVLRLSFNIAPQETPVLRILAPLETPVPRIIAPLEAPVPGIKAERCTERLAALNRTTVSYCSNC